MEFTLLTVWEDFRLS